MRSTLPILGLLLLATFAGGCASGEPARREEAAVEKPCVTALHEHVGKQVTIEGSVSKLRQAHVFTSLEGKHPEYVDVADWGQVVCYTTERLPEGKLLRLTGIVLLLGGGPPGSKARDFEDHQLDVSRWEPVAPK